MVSSSIGQHVTSLVGRGHDVEELEGILEHARLVTVIGPAGVGKTRLASEIASRAAHELAAAGGVWLCDLSDADSLHSFFVRVARTLGVPLGKGDAAAIGDQLESTLQERGPTMLVLDNFEQLGDETSAAIAAWNARVRHLWLLVTSRRPLRAPGEVVFDLAPLAESAAVELFVQRAKGRLRSFEPDCEALATIAAIVRRVDGLPLAIELAAPYVAALGLRAILEQLETAPSSLASKRIGAPLRHRSLDHALAWSWNRLDERLRFGLVSLSVLIENFGLDAARAVISGAGDAVEIVDELLDASLLHRAESDVSGLPRYRLLAVVRDFADRKLDELGAREAVEGRHAAHFTRRCGSAGDLSSEQGDLIAAFKRLSRATSDRAGDALTLAGAIDAIVSMRGPLSSRSALLDEAIATATRANVRDAAVGTVLLMRASAYLDDGRVAESLRDREEAAKISEALGDQRLRGLAIDALARHAWHEGRVADARGLFQEALTFERASGDLVAVGRTLTYLANAMAFVGDKASARGHYEEALGLLTRAGDRRGAVLAMGNLADLDHEMGLLELASSRCGEAIDVAREIGDRSSEACFLTNLGNVSIERGAPEEGRAQLELALAGHERVGNRRWAAITRGFLGRCFERLGDAVRAKDAYERALAGHAILGNTLFVGLVSCWFARLLGRRGALSDARHVLERGEAALRSAGENPWNDVARIVRAEIARRERSEGAESVSEADADAERRVRALLEGSRATLPAEVRSALAEMDGPRIDSSAPPRDVTAVVVSDTARWFRVPGEVAVSLQTRRALHLVLACLAEARARSPGEALAWEALLEAGWPGERVQTAAGASRVYTAVATLRRMGLRWILLRRDEGYLLDPAAAITRAPDEPSP